MAEQAKTTSPEIKEPSPKIQKLEHNSVVSEHSDLHPLFKVKKLSEKAILPSRGSPLSAGYDLSIGNTREVLHKFTVDLPKKHIRGGQSALHFARLRMEKRHNYVRKTIEIATQFFINPATSQPNVYGLILAGSVDFNTELIQTDIFDQRLQSKILNIVDVSYGGENGFNQAIELSSEILANVKFIQEKKLIGKYFEEISQDTGKYVFGVEDTLKGLEMGAVETLIVWENLDINRYELKNGSSGEIVIKHLNKELEGDQSNSRDSSTNAELEVQ